MNEYLTVLKKYTVFAGRATRKEYWMFTLISVVINVVLTVLDTITGLYSQEVGVGLLSGIYSFAILLPALAVTARRLHDTNRSGWWMLIALIPIVGWIVMLVFLVQDSTDDNQYGSNPKG